MWKKDEAPTGRLEAPAGPPAPTPAPTTTRTRATIGPSIVIRGDVTGSEDILIQGRVDGSVMLGHHAVGVGSEGRVKADITGRVITIEGEVEGDLVADEQIVLRGTARVQGDIKAPRVVLEDGATFRGLVDMGAAAEDESESVGAAAAARSAKGESTSASDRKPASTPARPGAASRQSKGSSTSGKSSSREVDQATA